MTSDKQHGNDARVLAIDIGTSSVRVMIFDRYGKVFVRKQSFYHTFRPTPNSEEQDPNLVREETYKTIAEALSEKNSSPELIEGISFSSQMYGIFPVDHNGKSLCNNILWSDSRAFEQASRYENSDQGLSLYTKTGCRPNAMFPLYKIIWISENMPELKKNIFKYVSVKEYVLFPLLQQWIIDYSMASGTGLFDISRKEWSQEALEIAGITENELSLLSEGTDGYHALDTTFFDLWGMRYSTLIFCGGGDGPLANIGSGAFSVGSVNIDLGTSGAARAVVNIPKVIHKGGLWCFYLSESLWVSGGILTNVGNAYTWLSQNVANIFKTIEPTEVMKKLDELSQNIPAGSDGLFFLPYLRKARSPHWNNQLVGTIFGIGPDHTVGHVTKAMLEAIGYDIAEIITNLEDEVFIESSIVLTGGFTKNSEIGQLLANILQKKVIIPHNSEGSISGAAILGFVGLHILENFSFETNETYIHKVYLPDEKLGTFYWKLRMQYKRLIDHLGIFSLERENV